MLDWTAARLRSSATQRRRLVGLAVAAVVCLGMLQGEALAKTSQQSHYTYRQTYGSALRLLKVDLGLTVTDHDPDWGYVLFDYGSRQDDKRKSQGSFEFVRGDDGVLVTLQIPAMPRYHERVILDRLKRKLAEEHGTPPRPKRPQKPAEDDEPDDSDDEPPKKSEKAGADDAKRRS